MNRRSSVAVRNHQRKPGLNSALLRKLVSTLLEEFLRVAEFELDIHIVGTPAIAALNEKYLRHLGPTDVLAFPYSKASARVLQGEIFVCLPEAVAQCRRFHTAWQRELVRYVVHGVLHLSGYDDTNPAGRRKMKTAEDRLLRQLAKRYELGDLHRRP